MSSEEAIKALLKILEAHESRSDTFDQELSDIHREWQRDRGIHIRLRAEIEALLSLVSEMAIRAGLTQAHVAICFRERMKHFQDKELREAEDVSPGLASQIDNRAASEIPTEPNFRPLFLD